MIKMFFLLSIISVQVFAEIISPIQVWAKVVSYDNNNVKLKTYHKTLVIPKNLVINFEELKKEEFQFIHLKEGAIENF